MKTFDERKVKAERGSLDVETANLQAGTEALTTTVASWSVGTWAMRGCLATGIAIVPCAGLAAIVGSATTHESHEVFDLVYGK